MNDWLQVGLALLLVVINGFFVAAEFAMVKVRGGKISEMAREGRAFAETAMWLFERLEGSLAACQLGITMASLALGWVGEPAFARILEPLLHLAGFTSPTVIHTVAFIFSFTTISSLHLVVGEQAPKIFAIRRPEDMLLWTALPLKWFYLFTYPLMLALNASTEWLLALMGMEGSAEHGTPHSEEEIRALLREAHIHGNLTGSEHRLLNAVFEFDDMVCRRVMVTRSEVVWLDLKASPEENLALIHRTKHTRYPVCNGSLDELLGVVHVKDLIGLTIDENFDWSALMRPPRKVPESLPISKVLRHFQATHQLLAFVVDEFGIVIGIVTLENVLEQIIGAVDDEFDTEEPEVIPDGPGQWIVLGSADADSICKKLDIDCVIGDADTFSGLLTERQQRLLNAGDKVDLCADFSAEVIEVRDDRAYRIRIRSLVTDSSEGDASEAESSSAATSA